jgi:hypothetical protein
MLRICTLTSATVTRQRSPRAAVMPSDDDGATTKRDQLTLMLRAKSADDPRHFDRVAEGSGHLPHPGGLARPTGWRSRVCPANRLVCRRLSRVEVPEGAVVLPWPGDPRAPRRTGRKGHRQHQAANPVMPEAIRQARIGERAEQVARARRVVRDTGLVNTSDYGPGIGLRPVRAHDSAMLREADVVVDDAPDPHCHGDDVELSVILSQSHAGSRARRRWLAADTLRCSTHQGAAGENQGIESNHKPQLAPPS